MRTCVQLQTFIYLWKVIEEKGAYDEEMKCICNKSERIGLNIQVKGKDICNKWQTGSDFMCIFYLPIFNFMTLNCNIIFNCNTAIPS